MHYGIGLIFVTENTKKKAGKRKHRRSKSAEASFTLPPEPTLNTDSEYLSTDSTNLVPDSDITGESLLWQQLPPSKLNI